MNNNIIDSFTYIKPDYSCIHDSFIGYLSDFSNNGDFDGWDNYYGIHTFGCFNGMLFGTVFNVEPYVGRYNVLQPLACEDYYIVKLTMKIKSSLKSSFKGRVMWRTLEDPIWDDQKVQEFDIINDNKWNVYKIHTGDHKYWQGTFNDLRIFPILDGYKNDEFFIKDISIESVNKKFCNKNECSYHSNYSPPCGGVGKRGYIKSAKCDELKFSIIEGVNDSLYIDIDGYGFEYFKIPVIENVTGAELASHLNKVISDVDIGGYFDCDVIYDEFENCFIISSGTYRNDSYVDILKTDLSVYVGFYSSSGVFLGKREYGSNSANLYKPKSTYSIKRSILYNLIDSSDNKYIDFNPDGFSIEGGRSDLVNSGFGVVSSIVHEDAVVSKRMNKLDGSNKTFIDLNHQFNNNGFITKIFIKGSIFDHENNEYFGNSKVKVFTPILGGYIKEIHSIDIEKPDLSDGLLISRSSEYIEIDCNIYVRKGDLLGVYNVDIYAGKSLIEGQVDALYYEFDGEAVGILKPKNVLGAGSSGLSVYARNNYKQSCLAFSVDLAHRSAISDVSIDVDYDSSILDYNIAMCADINWSVELFGGQYETGFVRDNNNGTFTDYSYIHDNECYGVSKLNDGVKTVNKAITASSYTRSDADGVIPYGANYFFVNGDEEWLDTEHHGGVYRLGFYVEDFEEDPIAFDIIFPNNSKKYIYKTVVYFKENQNFRTFSLQTIHGTDYNRYYKNVPKYNSVSIDDLSYYEGSYGYDSVDEYLFSNPSVGNMVIVDDDGALYDGYSSGNYIVENNEANLQLLQLNWNVLEHVFDPVESNGFRYRTDYHVSTKINEMELYCYVDEDASNVLGTTDVRYSYYDDGDIYSANVVETDNGVSAIVKDSPRYINFSFIPFKRVRVHNINIIIDDGSTYVGEKGCVDSVYLDKNKKGGYSNVNRIELKNIYNRACDIEVDVIRDGFYKNRTILFTKLNNMNSLERPLIGSDPLYHGRDDYLLLNKEGNCAINSDCYSLKNLIDGKDAYYTNDGITWFYYGKVKHGEIIDFTNIKDGALSVMKIPSDIVRDKFWRITQPYNDFYYKIREIQVLKDGKFMDCKIYHDVGVGINSPSLFDEAVHLSNTSTVGSYYEFQKDGYITIEFDEADCMDEIRIYHDFVPDYCENYFGVDRFTSLSVRSGSPFNGKDIHDISYNEHNIQVNGAYVGGPTISIDYDREFYFDTEPDDLVRYGSSFSEYTTVSGSLYFDLYSSSNSYDGCGLQFSDFGSFCTGRPFEIYAKVKIDFIEDINGGVSVGIISNYRYALYNTYNPDMHGVLIDFCGDGKIRTTIGASSFIDESANTFSLNTYYYCKINYDGSGNYYFDVWTDDFNGTSFFSSYTNTTTGFSAYLLGICACGLDTYYYTDEEVGYSVLGSVDYIRFVSDSAVSIDKYRFNEPAVYFDGSSDITVDYSSTFEIEFRSFFIDFFILFYDLPKDGEYIYIAKNDRGDPLGGVDYSGGWYVALTCNAGKYILRYSSSKNGSYFNQLNYTFGKIETGRWYYVYIERDTYQNVWNLDEDNYIYIDGERVTWSQSRYWNTFMDHGLSDLEIGKNLNGLIYDFKINITDADDRDFKARSSFYPTSPSHRYYSFDLFSSSDNIFYGRSFSVDLYKENSHSYYSDLNIFSSTYKSKFIIDLGQKHNIDFFRCYGVSGALSITDSDNAIYSSSDSANVEEIDIIDGDEVNLFLLGGECNASSLYDNNESYACANAFDESIYTTGRANSHNGEWIGWDFGEGNKYVINKIIYQLGWTYSWCENTIVYFEASNDDNPDWDEKEWTFIAEMSGWYGWVDKYYYFRDNRFASRYVRFVFYNYRTNPSVGARILKAYSHMGRHGARWAGATLINGDGVSRKMGKFGIYPDIKTYFVDGNRNCEWEYIGKSVTNYTEGTNLAYGCDVTGSSYFSDMYFSNLVDGRMGEKITECWGSDSNSTQWLVFDLGSIYSVYKLRLYHGRDGINDDYIINNYTISFSDDNLNYTTMFDITNNNDLIRDHILQEPVDFRYMRIDITKYKSKSVYLFNGESGSMFNGAILRYVEIFENYGNTILNSEDYPVVCVDLTDSFDIFSVDVKAVEQTSFDLYSVDLEDYSVAIAPYANSVNGASFKDYNDITSESARFVAFKIDKASYYEDNEVIYTKYLVVKSNNSINPCDYYYWWGSNISTISAEVAEIDSISVNSIVIDYPVSTGVDIIYFLKGDNFGLDQEVSWRDGFSFYLFIDDIDELDLDYGYVYLSGYDYTKEKNLVEHRWNLKTVFEYISADNGWNLLFLRFKDADEVLYTYNSFSTTSYDDPRRPDKITFDGMGISFKGKGNKPLKLKLNGFMIKRNVFDDSSIFDYGLYMCGKSCLFYNLSRLDMTSGTVEFWLRPDFYLDGSDYFNYFEYRSLFYVANNSNDIIGLISTIDGLCFYAGNTSNDLMAVYFKNKNDDSLDKLIHIGVNFSNDGSGTTDGSTLNLFINNVLVASSFDKWEVKDNKMFNLVFGGAGPVGIKYPAGNDSSIGVGGVISYIKVYNYCKYSFSESFKDDYSNVTYKKDTGDLVEISKDNLTFYSIEDDNLPLVYKEIPVNGSVYLYVRSDLKDKLKLDKRLSKLLIKWDVAI